MLQEWKPGHHGHGAIVLTTWPTPDVRKEITWRESLTGFEPAISTFEACASTSTVVSVIITFHPEKPKFHQYQFSMNFCQSDFFSIYGWSNIFYWCRNKEKIEKAFFAKISGIFFGLMIDRFFSIERFVFKFQITKNIFFQPRVKRVQNKTVAATEDRVLDFSTSLDAWTFRIPRK